MLYLAAFCAGVVVGVIGLVVTILVNGNID